MGVFLPYVDNMFIMRSQLTAIYVYTHQYNLSCISVSYPARHLITIDILNADIVT